MCKGSVFRNGSLQVRVLEEGKVCRRRNMHMQPNFTRRGHRQTRGNKKEWKVRLVQRDHLYFVLDFFLFFFSVCDGRSSLEPSSLIISSHPRYDQR